MKLSNNSKAYIKSLVEFYSKDIYKKLCTDIEQRYSNNEACLEAFKNKIKAILDTTVTDIIKLDNIVSEGVCVDFRKYILDSDITDYKEKLSTALEMCITSDFYVCDPVLTEMINKKKRWDSLIENFTKRFIGEIELKNIDVGFIEGLIKERVKSL